jgi:protein-arginine kinase activator protein McsA
MADKITRICPNCKNEFIVFHQQSRFCCDDCRKRYHAKMNKKPSRKGVPIERDRISVNKHDLERYRKNAKKSQEELIKTTVYARDQGETYGQYVSHTQAAEEDAKMRARHARWLAEQKKGEKKT